MFIQTTRRRDDKAITINVNQIAYILDLSEDETAIYFSVPGEDGLLRVVVSEPYASFQQKLRQAGAPFI